jgi:hypothetical protein
MPPQEHHDSLSSFFYDRVPLGKVAVKDLSLE